MDAVILAVIEHDHLTASLVINTSSFKESATHGVFNVVAHETVTIITQVERLILVINALASFEQRIIDASVFIFFAESDRNGLLVI